MAHAQSIIILLSLDAGNTLIERLYKLQFLFSSSISVREKLKAMLLKPTAGKCVFSSSDANGLSRKLDLKMQKANSND